ncbi:MAG: TPM domain-containing protein [Clostridia bacterium]|nr:TPM domain-containing protein [Clostridia bacterium]
MKKLLSILFALLLCLTLAMPAFAVNIPRLLDGADLLTESEEATLLARLDEVSESLKVDVIIAAEPNLGGMNPDAYAEEYYDFAQFGYGENRDGILLLISMEERDWCIYANGFAHTALSQEETDALGEELAGDLGDGNYVAAFNRFVDECEYQINGERNGFPFDFGKNILIALAVGLVVAFIATGVMKGKLKSVRRKAEADNYVKSGSMHITQSSDIYLYRTVNRVKKQTSSSSGSSGGRSSSHSSSGKF